MKIFVKAKPGAFQNKIEKTDETNFTVSVTEPPIQGRANKAIVELLAKYFGVSKTSIIIVSGATSRNKVMEINK